MHTQSKRLEQVAGYFAAGDTHLGYRRLLDAAIETVNFDVYEATLRFCDWYDKQSENADASALHTEVQGLLQTIANALPKTVEDTTSPRLEAQNVQKRYAKGAFSLSATTVTLRPSEIVGLVGENGNGKTTLLRILNGELKPDAGDVRYRLTHGTSAPTVYETKAALAFIPQRPLSWYGGLMENLQFAATFTGYTGRQNRLWTEMMVARMGLRPFRGYNWSRISSGYKMRFELARTLIRKPQVLLLDEPLANLDILAQQIILEDLRFLAQSATMPLSIILSSQQLYEVEKVSDQVVFLQKGVPKYQSLKSTTEVRPGLTIELEAGATRDELLQSLTGLAVQKLSFNGGVYIVYFSSGVSLPQVLRALADAPLPVKYLRDISTSSRRFFDA